MYDPLKESLPTKKSIPGRKGFCKENLVEKKKKTRIEDKKGEGRTALKEIGRATESPSL